MNLSHLAETIKSRREALGWSQRRLSREAGLNETAIKNIESGRSRSPRGQTLSAIAKALNCSIYDLIGENGETIENIDSWKTCRSSDCTSSPINEKLLRSLVIIFDECGKAVDGIDIPSEVKANLVTEYYKRLVDDPISDEALRDEAERVVGAFKAIAKNQ